MKTFYITVAIFLSLIFIIFINFIYINRTADRLSVLIENAEKSEGAEADIAALEEFWKNEQLKIGLSVSHIIVGKISDSIAGLKSLAESKETALFFRELSLLKEEIREMRRLEKFSCDNIL